MFHIDCEAELFDSLCLNSFRKTYKKGVGVCEIKKPLFGVELGSGFFEMNLKIRHGGLKMYE